CTRDRFSGHAYVYGLDSW
nr:immunoglobulin heavy chain junction region [Macaca mulatta]